MPSNVSRFDGFHETLHCYIIDVGVLNFFPCQRFDVTYGSYLGMFDPLVLVGSFFNLTDVGDIVSKEKFLWMR